MSLFINSPTVFSVCKCVCQCIKDRKLPRHYPLGFPEMSGCYSVRLVKINGTSFSSSVLKGRYSDLARLERSLPKQAAFNLRDRIVWA